MVTTQDHQLIIWINLSLSKSYGTKLFRYKTWPDIFFIDKHDQQAFLWHHQCFFRTRTRRHAHFDQYECQCLSFKRALATLFFRACVEWRDCCSLHAVTASVIYYSTHTRKNVIYLFDSMKIQMVY